MNLNKFFFFGLLFCNCLIAQQKIGNNKTTLNPNAVLEIESNNKGMLMPRLALTSTDNASPLTLHVEGMTVYNTATSGSGITAVTPGFYFNNGTIWVRIADEALVKQLEQIQIQQFSQHQSDIQSLQNTVTQNFQLLTDANTLQNQQISSIVDVNNNQNIQINSLNNYVDQNVSQLNNQINIVQNNLSGLQTTVAQNNQSLIDANTVQNATINALQTTVADNLTILTTAIQNPTVINTINGSSFTTTVNGTTSNPITLPQGPAGPSGQSAFEIAVTNGFSGTESQWLSSLQGPAGPIGTSGSSAFQVAVANGFSGTESQWLASLQGPAGTNGANGQGVPTGGTANQVLSKVDGTDYNTRWVTLNTQGDLRLVNGSSHITQDAGVGSNGTSAGNTDVVAIGSGSANANTGRYNVFLGSNTGKFNTSGENNTFVGFRAGEGNTTGSINTFLGNWAGASNTSGSNNNFLGHFSGGLNTTGFSNTFIGHEAGKGNTTGFRNVAIGQFALERNTEAVHNTAIGVDAMKNTNNGGHNVAVGFQSALNITNAQYNTALGTASLLYTTTGSRNIGIGRAGGENLTTGNDNIAIGNSTWFPSPTGNNQLNIGNIIYGNGIDGSANNISTGNIGIGVSIPSQRLDVAGAVKFSGALMPNNTAGTAGQVLTSTGSGSAPTWTTLSSTSTLYNGDGSLTNNRLVTMGTNTIAFNSNATNGTSHFTIDGTTLNVDAVNNRVGFGTTNPIEKMHINGGNLLIVDNLNNGGWIKGFDDHHSIYMREGGLNVMNFYEFGGNLASGSGYIFKTGGLKSVQTTKMQIADDGIYMSGNVGLGTISPSQRLDVAGAVKFSGALMPNNTAGTAGQVLTSTGSGSAPTWTTISSAPTLYNGDGSLAGNRSVTQGTNTLAFTSSATSGTSHFTVDGATLNVDAVNNRVGFGVIDPLTVTEISQTMGASVTYPLIISNRMLTQGTGVGIKLSPTNAPDSRFAAITAMQVSGNNNWLDLAFSTATGALITEKMRITNTGNVGIGTTSPSAKLDVEGAVLIGGASSSNKQGTHIQWNKEIGQGATSILNNRGAGSGGIRFGDVNSSDVVTEWARFQQNGNFGIGTSSPSSKLDVAGGKIKLDVSQTLTTNPNDNFTHNGNTMSHYGIGWYNDSWNTGGSTTYISGYAGMKVFTQGSLAMSIDQGGITRNGSGWWTAFSDARIKTVKEEFKDGLSVVKQINPVTFTYNDNAPFKSKELQIGIIAQDLEKIAPYMVNKTNQEGIADLREVNTQAYVFLLINSVKEQQVQIEQLKKEIEELKTKK